MAGVRLAASRRCGESVLTDPFDGFDTVQFQALEAHDIYFLEGKAMK